MSHSVRPGSQHAPFSLGEDSLIELLLARPLRSSVFNSNKTNAGRKPAYNRSVSQSQLNRVQQELEKTGFETHLRLFKKSLLFAAELVLLVFDGLHALSGFSW
jgi:hypothetical protein